MGARCTYAEPSRDGTAPKYGWRWKCRSEVAETYYGASTKIKLLCLRHWRLSPSAYPTSFDVAFWFIYRDNNSRAVQLQSGFQQFADGLVEQTKHVLLHEVQHWVLAIADAATSPDASSIAYPTGRASSSPNSGASRNPSPTASSSSELVRMIARLATIHATRAWLSIGPSTS